METTGTREAIDALLGSVDSIMQPDLVVLRPEQSLADAADELERAAVSGAPVMRQGRVVGMVSLSDLFQAIGVPPNQIATSGPWHRYEHKLAQSHQTVADVMTRHVVSLPPDASVPEAASLMRVHRINRIPVVDSGGTLRGIVARDDIIAAVAKAAGELHELRGHRGAPVLAPD